MPNRMEEIASKTMGKAKAAKASVQGLEGIFKKLTEEHGEAAALLKRVATSSDPDVRSELFPKIRAELLSHEKGEVQVLYPILERHADTREIAEDHNEEAEEMEQLIERLHAMDTGDAAWGSTFEQLVQIVQHHVQEEEEEYFPTASEIVGDQADELENRYAAAKQKVMERLA